MELSADVERIMKKYLNPSYSWDREPPQTVESPFKKVGAQLDQQIKDAKEESDRYLRQYLYTVRKIIIKGNKREKKIVYYSDIRLAKIN